MTPQKIALLTDSCADLTPHAAAGHPIWVVPLRIRCEDGEYRDGVDIHAQDILFHICSFTAVQSSHVPDRFCG